MFKKLIILFLLVFTACGTENMGNSPNLDGSVEKLDTKPGPAPIPEVFTIQDIPIYDPLSEYSDEYKEE